MSSSSWGLSENAANSVTYAPYQYHLAANSVNQAALYANTTIGAFANGVAIGQVAVNAASSSNTANDMQYAAHSGWNIRTAGTGFVKDYKVTVAGSGYANGDVVNVAAPATGANAHGVIATNVTGGITSVTLSSYGSGFPNTAPTLSFANSSGGATSGVGATVVPNVSGRAGRISYETLIAMGSIS